MPTPPNPSRPPAVQVMRNLGLEPDPWQVEVLEAGHPRLLLNCCRQAGKSTVVALLGLVEALFVPGTKVLLVSRSHRQSTELFRIVTDFYRRLGSPLLRAPDRGGAAAVQPQPHRLPALPGGDDPRLLATSACWSSTRPPASPTTSTARSGRCWPSRNGRLICLSTPYGKRGFFHDAWANGGGDWARIEVPAERIRRITPEFLAEERRAPGRVVVPPGIRLLVRGAGRPGLPRLRPLRGRRRPGAGRRAGGSAASTSASATPSRPSGACWTATACSG